VDGAGPRDYVCIQAYLAPDGAAAPALAGLRSLIADRTGLATTVGWGPRFLHSTGQLHKGGPASGIFLQLVDRPHSDLRVPETTYSFGDLIAAQAAGDLQALLTRGRRVLAIDLGQDAARGLAALAAMASAL
jgi:transaldolase/glucose-6-phosphate isomerase